MKFLLKITISICLLVFTISSLNAQVNLVNNGYFEVYDTCPNYPGQISRSVGWLKSSLTPDYYNSCLNVNSNSGMNVPHAYFGYQKDCCGGTAFAGIYTFNFFFPNNGRDYIQTKLNDTLKAGRKYLASMYVSSCNDYDYSIASIGMLFTDTAVQAPQNIGFINRPNAQVKNTTLLNDTLNWMLVQDTVIGTGSELYLTIGNFNYDSLSDTVRVYNMANQYYSYYYIDGVTVYDLATVGINKLSNNIEINIYPNPANNKIHVEAKEIKEIKLFDVLGNEIITTKEKDIDVSNLSDGIYFIQVNTNGNTSIQKIVIQ